MCNVNKGCWKCIQIKIILGFADLKGLIEEVAERSCFVKGSNGSSNKDQHYKVQRIDFH